MGSTADLIPTMASAMPLASEPRDSMIHEKRPLSPSPMAPATPAMAFVTQSMPPRTASPTNFSMSVVRVLILFPSSRSIHAAVSPRASPIPSSPDLIVLPRDLTISSRPSPIPARASFTPATTSRRTFANAVVIVFHPLERSFNMSSFMSPILPDIHVKLSSIRSFSQATRARIHSDTGATASMVAEPM